MVRLEICDSHHDSFKFCRVSTIGWEKVRLIRLRDFMQISGKVDVVIALLCPGQGSQTPGLLQDWLEIEGAQQFLEGLSQAADTDLVALGTTGNAEEIKDTAVAQPLIVATSLLTTWVLSKELGPVHTWAGVVAGHSVGEFAATAIARVLTEAEATNLVGVRGRAMASAAKQADTGMAAVMGPDLEAITSAIENAHLVPANINGGGQVVAAGLSSDIEAFAANPPERTRVVPLAVAGAFHTNHMAGALEKVQSRVTDLSPADPRLPLLSNVNGEPVTSGKEMVNFLVSQITSPVRWDLCQATMTRMGVSAIIELAPAGVLTGLARRTMRGVPSVAVKSPDDLDDALNLIAEHRPAATK